MKTLRGAVILAAWAATAGCAGHPSPEVPTLDVELPTSWESGHDRDAAAPSATDWWREFGDAELDRLVPQVLESNRDLAAAAARVDAAAAQARIAGADRKPRVSASSSAQRNRSNFIGLPIPGQEGQVSTSTSTSLGVDLSVSWEVDLWGRLRANRSAAKASTEAARADWEAVRLSLAGQTAKAWFAIAEARLQLELAEETLASRASTRERIRRRYDLGTRDALDLRLAIASEAGARSATAARARSLDAVERQLQLLLSRYPAAGSFEAAGSLPAPPSSLPTIVPAELLARRPDLAATESRLAAAGYDVAASRAALYPALSLSGSAGRLSSELEDLLDSDFSVWSLAANLLQPVFQGGRLRAAVDLSEARRRELTETYVQAALVALGEVELALAALGSLEEQAEALRTAVAQSKDAQRLAERRYDAGLVDYLAVLESQREATQSQVELLSIRRQQLDARVDLHLALGGGFVHDGPDRGLAGTP